MNVAVAFSGGVDSAVCVRLLQARGHAVTAWHLLLREAAPGHKVACHLYGG